MPPYLLEATLFPVLITMLWAIIVKIRLKDWKNSFFLTIAGLTLLVNGFVVSLLITEDHIPFWLLLVQMLLSVTVVPQAYYYFCRQMGTRGSVGLKWTLWLLLLILFVPSINVDIHPAQEAIMHDPILLMHFNIFDNGARIYAITLPSVVILLQALLTCLRVPVVAKVARSYELRVTLGAKIFILWWLLAIVFCVVSSLIEIEMLRTPTASWVYYGVYTFLIMGIYILIAMKMDINPVRTGDDEEVESIDNYIEENKDLADRARRLFMEEKLYLRQGLVTDDVVRMLGTNRTYFTRMMRAEFNMSFNEFVTAERVAYSKQLLTATEKTLDEIALESGFGNASAYCRVFKRITNTSPDSWRKDHREDNFVAEETPAEA